MWNYRKDLILDPPYTIVPTVEGVDYPISHLIIVRTNGEYITMVKDYTYVPVHTSLRMHTTSS